MLPEQPHALAQTSARTKMLRDLTEMAVFRAGTEPETGPVRFLLLFVSSFSFRTWLKSHSLIACITGSYLEPQY